MYCENCKERPATVHITRIVNNDKQQLNLCEECASEYQLQWGFNLASDFSLQQFLANMLQIDTDPARREYIGAVRCPECGLTLEEFRSDGKLGCGQCYQAFEGVLGSLIRRVQGSSRHTGKAPERTAGAIRVRQQINQVRKSLDAAIQKEEFEEAARLRDRIKQLEGQLKGAGQ